MSEAIFRVIAAMGVIVLLGMVVLWILATGSHALNNMEKISACEQNLPRDQHCKLVAVFDEGGE